MPDPAAFERALAHARERGVRTFQHEGRTYSTETGEMIAPF